MEKITLFGKDFFLDKNNSLGLTENHGHAEFVTKVMLKYLQPWHLAVDVGAFIGYTTVILANHASRVFAFEPTPEIFKILYKNVAYYPNISIYNLALGREFSEKELFLSEEFPADNRVTYVEGRKSVSITVNTLDSLFNEFLLPINFLKIDTQGFDGEVLFGGFNTIYKHRPIIIFELAPYLQKESSISCWETFRFLDFLNYFIYNIDQASNQLVPATPSKLLSYYREELPIHTDILCIPK